MHLSHPRSAPRLSLVALTVALSGSAQAALLDRGNGLIYDSVLNVTWLQDANLAATETFGVADIDATGRMDRGTADGWIEAMNAAAYKGYSDWMLPFNLPLNGVSYTGFSSADFWTGTRDTSYNISSTLDPLGKLFYASLGNLGLRSTAGVDRSLTGALGVDYGLVNSGPFSNLTLSSNYWTGPTNPTTVGVDQGWFFSFRTGYQAQVFVDSNLFVWALRPGDVAAVPEPATGALMLVGAGLITAAARRRRCTGRAVGRSGARSGKSWRSAIQYLY
jgi:hypothetical protein